MARPLDPECVAAGEGRPGVAELIALIHRINPTDRGLGEAEKARRYAIKAKLQSRLVRDWAGHLEIREEDDNVLAISHRGHSRDAAHVPRSALEPDARMIVDRLLAFGADEPGLTTPYPITSPRSGSDRLAAGRAALDEWDFEGARAHFAAELAATGSEPAAHALLELLVDQLADEAAALQVDVPDRALTPRVARLLALAAARVGDDRADALLGRLDRTGEVEVRLLLGARAVRHEDVAVATRHVEALRDLDPANGNVLDLAETLRTLRAAPLVPLEQALAAAIAHDDLQAVRDAAEALLAAAPGHPSARRAVAELDRRERHAEAERLVAAAVRHRAEGRYDLEVHALERADHLQPGCASDLGEARARLAAQVEDRAIAAAVSALDRGDLTRYVDLPLAARAKLRHHRPSDARLDLLDQLSDGRDPLRALRVLQDARGQLDAGRPDRALERLADAGLDGHPAARQLVREARAGLDRQRREAAVTGAEAVGRIVAEGRVELALAEAARVRIDLLPEVERNQFESVVAEARRRAAEKVAIDDFDRAMRQCALMQARDHAEARAADPVWRRRLDAVEDRIRRMFIPTLVHPEDVPLYRAQAPAVQLSPDASIESDGRHAWIAEALGHWCYLRRIEISTQRVVSCLRIRTTHPYARPRTVVHGNRVFVGAAGARALAFEVADDGSLSRLLHCVNGFGDLLPEVLAVDLGRDRGFHPLFVGNGKRGETWVTITGSTQLALARFGDVISAHALHVPGVGARQLLVRDRGALVLFDPVVNKEGGRVGWALRVDSVAPTPDGTGLVCCGAFPGGDKGDLEIAVLDPKSELPKRRAGLGGMHGARPIASSSVTGLLYVLMDAIGDRPVLRALDPELRTVWRIPVEGAVHLLTDVEDRHAALLMLTRSGLHIVPLGTEPPSLPEYPLAPTYGWRRPWSDLIPTDVRTPSGVTPVGDRIRAAITLSDAAVPPRTRFHWLDMIETWETGEVESLYRLADAALQMPEMPREQQLHAVAAYFDSFARCWQSAQEEHGERNELPGLVGAKTAQELTALFDRVRGWLDERAVEDGWEPITTADPKWTSSRDWA